MGARNPQSVGGEPALTPPQPYKNSPRVRVLHPAGRLAGSSWGFVNKNIYFAFFCCLYRTAQSLRWAGAGPARGGAGPSSGSGGIGCGDSHKHWGGARAGEECIEAFPGRKGGAETFVLHQLPQGLEPHTGGCGQESGLNPSRGGGARRGGVKWLRWGSPTALQCQPPSSGEPGGSVCVALAQGRANKGATAGRLGGGSRPGGEGALCQGREGAQGGWDPRGCLCHPAAGAGFSAESVLGPEASWGEQRAQPRSRPFFTQICSPRAASAPWCSWIWAAPGGSPEPGSR